jgi:hypothetical protein
LEKKKNEVGLLLLKKIEGLEKEVKKEKIRSNAVINGFQGLLKSQRAIKKIPLKV